MKLSLAALPVIGLVLAVAPTVDAGAYNPKQVAADAVWVVHVDMDACRDSALGRAIGKKHFSSDEAKAKIADATEKLGMNPLKDIHSMTLYDNRYVEDSGLLLIHASNIDQKHLVKQLGKKHPDHATAEHGSHTLYTWTEAKGKSREHQVTGCFFGNQHVMFSRNTDQVRTALDALDGKAGSLPNDSPLAETAAAGCMVLLRAADMNKHETPIKQPVIRESTLMTGAFGESDEKLFYHGKLVVKNAEVAGQVQAIVDGVRALVLLQHKEQGGQTRKLLDALKIATTGKTVTVEWQAGVQEVMEAAERHKKDQTGDRKQHKRKQKPR